MKPDYVSNSQPCGALLKQRARGLHSFHSITHVSVLQTSLLKFHSRAYQGLLVSKDQRCHPRVCTRASMVRNVVVFRS